jgi:chromosome segregation ATPase
MLKNWLTSGAIAFGVSCACVLPFNRDLAQSVLIGLATIPGAIACSSLRLRQRDRHVNRQLTAEISRLNSLRQQSERLDRHLKVTIEERQSLEARVRQLNNLVANLTDRIERDTKSQQQLEQNLAAIVTYCGEREEIITKLNTKISDKQASLLDLTAQIGDVQQQLTQAEAELTKKESRSEYLATQIIAKTNELVINNRNLSAIRAELNVSQVELANLENLEHNHTGFDDRALVNLRLQLDNVEVKYKEKQAQLEYLENQLFSKNNDIVASDRELQLTKSQLTNRQAELVDLETQIQAKIAAANEIDLDGLKAQLETLASERNTKQTQLAELAAQLTTKTTEIASSDRSLQSIQSEIGSRQSELVNLAAEHQAKIAEVERIDLISLRTELEQIESARSAKQAQLAELESQLLTKTTAIESSDRTLQLTQSELSNRQVELANLTAQIQAQTEAASQIDIVALRAQLNSIELQSREKQARLAELETQLVTKNTELATIQNNLTSTQLELQDRRTELDDLEDKIYAKLEEMDDVDRDLNIALQRLQPQPPQTSRGIENLLQPGEWHQNFIDNPHLEILQHIEKHGAIAESEVNHKLGNPRSVRQFANKLEEYTQYLPFAIRVESSPQGNRYLRDSHN